MGNERASLGEAEYVPLPVPGIAPATLLWVAAFGLGFWLTVAQGVLWLV